MRGALAAEQSRDVSGSESDVPAHGQHDVRVILAYALALSERFLGGGADGGGGRRVDERFEHLVHHLTGLVDRRAVGRQGRDAFTQMPINASMAGPGTVNAELKRYSGL